MGYDWLQNKNLSYDKCFTLWLDVSKNIWILPLVSSLLVASTGSFITYTTYCEYEKDCRTIFTLISEVEDIKISKFETRVNSTQSWTE